MYIKKTYFEHR